MIYFDRLGELEKENLCARSIRLVIRACHAERRALTAFPSSTKRSSKTLWPQNPDAAQQGSVGD